MKSFGPWESDLKDKVLARTQDLDETHHILDARVSPDGTKVAYRFLLDDPKQVRQMSYVLFVKPVRGGPRGDLFCRVVVETPVHLSAEQKELIRQLEGTLKENSTRHAPREQGFFEGVKRFFSSGTR